MNADDILLSKEFKKCVDFHGHICPGLAIGYRASKAGLDWLKENRSVDEEIVAIVETDSCAVDAVQVLTGCTFGKGNFIYKDTGKSAFTFFSRQSNKGVRIFAKPGDNAPTDRHMELIGKVMNNTATEEEKKEFRKLHDQKCRNVLETSLEDLFVIKQVNTSLPQKAKIEPSEICAGCGEPVMLSKLNVVDGLKLCRDCLD